MDAIKQELVVISAQQYDMISQDTGEKVEGTSVRYILNNNLKPFSEGNLKGYKLAKSSLGFNEFSEFVEVPGVYDADVVFSIGGDGKVKANATNFKFKKSLFPAPAGK